MKLTQKQGEKLAEFIAAFLINSLIFGVASIFTELTFGKSMLYALINAVWMPFLLFPILPKIASVFEKKNKYKLNPLLDYISDFEKRQIEISKDVEKLESNEKELLKKYKYDWKLYRKFLKTNKVKYLYHFTDKSNLDSILNSGGLFSRRYCNENKIYVNKPGGDSLSYELDKRADLDDYVRLSFTPNHPMMYYAMNEGRIDNPVILKLNIELIYWKDSKYSDSNATSKNSRIGENFDSLSIIDFDILKKTDYLNAPTDKKKYFQAEVLIKNHIPIQYIDNILEYTE
jgi:hypothetical protein